MKSVRCLVDNLWRNLELDNFSSRSRALKFWDKVVGEKISPMCSVTGFSGAIINVRAFNSAAAMELRYRSNEITAALNKLAGKELFISLKITIRPTHCKER